MNAPNSADGLRNEGNELFPIFLKLNELRVLLVGAGNVGLEKLNALLSNSPEARITVVAESVLPEFERLASGGKVDINTRTFREQDLQGQDLVVVATGNDELNQQIRKFAKQRHLLINVADKPALCDFYLGSIVKKGDLKIAISTNGKSPTMAKRLKEVFQDAIPNEVDLSLQQLNQLRNSLEGDFAAKVARLNEATALLVDQGSVKAGRPKAGWFIWLAAILTLLAFLAFMAWK